MSVLRHAEEALVPCICSRPDRAMASVPLVVSMPTQPLGVGSVSTQLKLSVPATSAHLAGSYAACDMTVVLKIKPASIKEVIFIAICFILFIIGDPPWVTFLVTSCAV